MTIIYPNLCILYMVKGDLGPKICYQTWDPIHTSVYFSGPNSFALIRGLFESYFGNQLDVACSLVYVRR